MKRICIKLGGRLLEQADERSRVARAIAEVRNEGNELLLVHGGGAQLGDACAAMGLLERKHEGLRITDQATARVATWVLTGEVNKALVGSLVREGLPAIGLCGADLGLFSPRRKQMPGVNLGYVGELSVEDVDGKRLDALISGDLLPVLATMGPEAFEKDDSPLLNVNADEAAGPIAAAAQADELIFLSDVAGVQGAEGELLPLLAPAKSQELIADGIIVGGMIPKVRAALAALEDGVPSVRIASGTGEDPIRAALAGNGTRFVSTAEATDGGAKS